MKSFDITRGFWRKREKIFEKGRTFFNKVNQKLQTYIPSRRSANPATFMMASCLVLSLCLGIHSYYENFYHTVYFEDSKLGLVEDTETVKGFMDELTEIMSEQYETRVEIESSVRFSEAEFHHAHLDDTEEILDFLTKELQYSTWAYKVNIDDQASFYLFNRESYEELIEEIKNTHIQLAGEEREFISIEPKEKIKGTWEQISPEEVMTTQEAFAYLSPDEPFQRVHLSSRGAREADNEESGEDVFNELTLVSVEEYKEEESIPYDTQYEDTDELKRGETEVKEEGEKGVKEILYHITWENDEKVEKEKVEEVVVEEPKDEIILEGTKLHTYSSNEVSEGSGDFIWPIPSSYDGGGRVTRGFTGGHSGLDIYASTLTSTPIVAAGSGTVVAASYDGGYGNTVVIDHGSHYTVYAHCSEMLVSPGESVEKGSTIAYMGNTGRTYGRTGIHLHFEIRTKSGGGWKSANPVNPRNYF